MALELSTEALRVLAEDDSTLDSYSYFVPLDQSVVTGLSEAIGAEPTITKYGDDQADPDYVTYEWSGALLTAGRTVVDTEYADWAFNISAPTVGALSAATDSGIVIGATREEAVAAGAVRDDTESQEIYKVGVTTVERAGNPLEFCLYLEVVGDSVTSFGGPAHTLRG